MRHKIFPIIALFILLAFNAKAQNVQNTTKPLSQDETDKREVLKFAESFLQNLFKTGNLNKVSSKFFAKDFRKSLAGNDSWISFCISSGEWIGELPTDEKYRDNIAIINFFHLLGLVANRTIGKNIDYEDLNKEDSLSKYFPPNIFRKLKESKWLRGFVEKLRDDDIISPQNIKDWRDFMNEVELISNILRQNLKKYPSSLFKQIMKRAKESSEYFPAEKCQGERCLGLPKGTPIFIVHQALMCLRISKLNGKLKIVNIYSIIEES
ncbi:MAG: hypothetical protein K1X72_24960 [Pyrinomonadaceae bacterium]|nr:hypothetical protein [Pyrinomonadaceae bacterium]